MKSQKIRNRAPRPFKSPDPHRGGGGSSHNFIPFSAKPTARPVKRASPPAPPKAQDETSGDREEA